MKEFVKFIAVGVIVASGVTGMAIAAGPTGTPPNDNRPNATFNSVDVNGAFVVDENGFVSNPSAAMPWINLADADGVLNWTSLLNGGLIFSVGSISTNSFVSALDFGRFSDYVRINKKVSPLASMVAIILSTDTSSIYGNISNSIQVDNATQAALCTAQGGVLRGTPYGPNYRCTFETRFVTDGLQLADSLGVKNLKVNNLGNLSRDGNIPVTIDDADGLNVKQGWDSTSPGLLIKGNFIYGNGSHQNLSGNPSVCFQSLSEPDPGNPSGICLEPTYLTDAQGLALRSADSNNAIGMVIKPDASITSTSVGCDDPKTPAVETTYSCPVKISTNLTASGSIGRFYTVSSGLISVAAGTNGTASVSCDSGDVAVSCNAGGGSALIPHTVRNTSLTGSANQKTLSASRTCQAWAFNSGIAAANLQAYAVCFSSDG